MDPDVGEHGGVGQLEAATQLDAQPAEDVGGDVVRVGDDEDAGRPPSAPVRSMTARCVSSERNFTIGPLRVPSASTARWARPFAPKRFARSVSSSISRRVMPASPGATMALTRPPAASAESKTTNPEAP